MKHLGEGIAFAALVGGAVALEVNGKDSGLLWLLIVMWAVCRYLFREEREGAHE